MYFLVCKGLSSDGVGRGGKGHRISGNTAGAGFKTGDFVEEKLGGATVERLPTVRMVVVLVHKMLSSTSPNNGSTTFVGYACSMLSTRRFLSRIFLPRNPAKRVEAGRTR